MIFTEIGNLMNWSLYLIKIRWKSISLAIIISTVFSSALLSGIAITSTIDQYLAPFAAPDTESVQTDFGFSGVVPLELGTSDPWNIPRNVMMTTFQTINLLETAILNESLVFSVLLDLDSGNVSRLIAVSDDLLSRLLFLSSNPMAEISLVDQCLGLIQGGTGNTWHSFQLAHKQNTRDITPIAVIPTDRLFQNFLLDYTYLFPNDVPLAITTYNHFWTIITALGFLEVNFDGYFRFDSSKYDSAFSLKYSNAYTAFSSVMSNEGEKAGIQIKLISSWLISYSIDSRTFLMSAQSLFLFIVVLVLFLALLILIQALEHNYNTSRAIQQVIDIKGISLWQRRFYRCVEASLIFGVSIVLAYFLGQFLAGLLAGSDGILEFSHINLSIKPDVSTILLIVVAVLFLVMISYQIIIVFKKKEDIKTSDQASWYNEYYEAPRNKGILSKLDVAFVVSFLILLVLRMILPENDPLHSLVGLGLLICFFWIPRITVFLILYLSFFIERISLKKHWRFPGIHSIIFKLNLTLFLRRTMLVFALVLVILSATNVVQSFDSSMKSQLLYQSGSDISISRSGAFNQTFISDLAMHYGIAGMTFVSHISSFLGTDSTPIQYDFQILAIDSPTYLSAVSLSKDNYHISDSPSLLLSNLNVPQDGLIPVLMDKHYAQSQGISPNDKFRFYNQDENQTLKQREIEIIGTFELWPGFVPVEEVWEETHSDKIRIIMDQKFLANFTTISIVELVGEYLIKVNSPEDKNEVIEELQIRQLAFKETISEKYRHFLNSLVFLPINFIVIFCFILVCFRASFEANRSFNQVQHQFALFSCFGMTHKQKFVQVLLEFTLLTFLLLLGALLSIITSDILIQMLVLPVLPWSPLTLSFDSFLLLLLLFFISTTVDPLVYLIRLKNQKIDQTIAIED
ncbi:MAG: hypothetical protein ACFFD4_00875 [Candidatus Odinarchaeota archaeon]